MRKRKSTLNPEVSSVESVNTETPTKQRKKSTAFVVFEIVVFVALLTMILGAVYGGVAFVEGAKVVGLILFLIVMLLVQFASVLAMVVMLVWGWGRIFSPTFPDLKTFLRLNRKSKV